MGARKEDIRKQLRKKLPFARQESVPTWVPFAAYIHPSNANSGAYSGLSFAVFPVPDAPCLIGLVIGTQGLAPDEATLGHPGHSRKVNAICSWLNSKYGHGMQVAWAKQDPTRTDIPVPDTITNSWSAYKTVFHRYGREMYALFRPTDNREATTSALSAFLDLLFEERGHKTLGNYEKNYIRNFIGGLVPIDSTTELGLRFN